MVSRASDKPISERTRAARRPVSRDLSRSKPGTPPFLCADAGRIQKQPTPDRGINSLFSSLLAMISPERPRRPLRVTIRSQLHARGSPLEGESGGRAYCGACPPGTFKYSLANSWARLSALPLGTTSATTPPLLRDSRGNRLRIQEECLSPTCSGAITPRCENPVARNNASGEMGRVAERCAFSRHNHIAKQGIFGMHMARSSIAAMTSTRMCSLQSERLHREPGSNIGIAHVAERCKINSPDEVAACSG